MMWRVRAIQMSPALMPHPTQRETKGSGSPRMGMLERFMGTTSARAAGGSPLTMLWLLLWTINRCSFSFSPPPLPLFSLAHHLTLRLVSPCEMTTVLPYEFGKHTMRHERGAIMASWPSKLNRITQIGMWGKRTYTESEPTQCHSECGSIHDNISKKSNPVEFETWQPLAGDCSGLISYPVSCFERCAHNAGKNGKLWKN